MLACETPFTRGPSKGQPTTGTARGGVKHYLAGEKPCEPCRIAQTEMMNERYRKQHPKKVGEWCRRRLHRMEGDNIYIIPSTGTRNCLACKRASERRQTSQCERCGEWFTSDEAWDRHQVWMNQEVGSRCRTPEEMRSRGLKLWSNPLGMVWVVPSRRKTHCVNGHLLRGRNLKYDNRGSRVCRSCANERTRRWYARKKAEREADTVLTHEVGTVQAGQHQPVETDQAGDPGA